ALDAAFSADRPHLVEAITDVNVPMLPPQISFEQAESFFAALSKGDEDAAAIVRQSVREMLAKTQTDGD
ncbi:MAG: thiamine pyrophosphate-requiring protein, partial [Candidatus Eremiobacteraeota bacterium]|nr:thiamine pyrophosphate-requiring protein [Candidatus Eremiobacteraeota bacterium]